MTFMGLVHKMVKTRTEKSGPLRVVINVQRDAARAEISSHLVTDVIQYSNGLIIHDTELNGDVISKKTYQGTLTY